MSRWLVEGSLPRARVGTVVGRCPECLCTKYLDTLQGGNLLWTHVTPRLGISRVWSACCRCRYIPATTGMGRTRSDDGLEHFLELHRSSTRQESKVASQRQASSRRRSTVLVDRSESVHSACNRKFQREVPMRGGVLAQSACCITHCW